MEQTEKKGFIARLTSHKEPVANSFAILGLIVVLIVFLIGAVFIVKYAYVGVGRLAAGAVSLSSQILHTNVEKEQVVPEVSSAEVQSGKPFTLSWQHLQKATDGSYSVYYPCAEGLFLTAVTLDGNKTVLCNKYFDFVNQGNQLILVASSSATSTVDLPIVVTFTKNGDNNPSVDGTIHVTITNKNIKVPVATGNTTNQTIVVNAPNPAPTQTVTTGTTPGQTTTNFYPGGNTAPAVNNPNGKPDLQAVFIETGTLDANNVYTKTDTLTRSASKIAVKFKIVNNGDKVAGPFNFNAYLPTYPAQTFNSDMQTGLQPGDSIEYTLGFDKAVAGNNPFTIRVDGGNLVAESNETNNDMTTTLRIQ